MKLPKREKGQGLVEYALLLVLVAVVVIGILSVMGQQVSQVFTRIVNELSGAGGGYAYNINSFNVTASSGSSGCNFSASATVKVTDASSGTNAPDGTLVTGTTSNPSISLSGTVNGGSGTASLSGSSSAGGACGNGTASLTLGNSSDTDPW